MLPWGLAVSLFILTTTYSSSTMARGSIHGDKRIRDEFERRKKSKDRLGAQPPAATEELGELLSGWVIAIDDFLKEEGPTDCKFTMFRVPENMRQVEKSAYNPQLVSIGPFHANDKSLLLDMEDNKMRYLLHLLARFRKHEATIESLTFEKLVKTMKKLEWKTRNCYSEDFQKITSDEFVLMMLLDGCFVVELLRLYNDFFNGKKVDDPIFKSRWVVPILQRDLFMLENQLPFFVLQEIFKLSSKDGEPSLTELTLKFFNALLSRETEMLKQNYKMGGDHDHMLGLFRSSFTSKLKKKESETPTEERPLVKPVTELIESGIKFKKRENKDLLDIAFNKKGVLEIPTLIVDDHTIHSFLNLVAYEQCCPEKEPFFTDYVLFIDSLVNSPKDIEILHYDGIIEHVLGSYEDVANIFNNLCKEVVLDMQDGYLFQHLKGVKKYTDEKRNRWRAKLMHDYFNSPWAFLSLLAAIVLLLLTVAQTIFAFLSYLRPTT